jgi:hypothetical protein
MLSVFPWTRFPGWQWLLVALAVPVATWAAWPFHAAALVLGAAALVVAVAALITVRSRGRAAPPA